MIKFEFIWCPEHRGCESSLDLIYDNCTTIVYLKRLTATFILLVLFFLTSFLARNFSLTLFVSLANKSKTKKGKTGTPKLLACDWRAHSYLVHYWMKMLGNCFL